MKLKQFKAGVLFLAVGTFIVSCEPEIGVEDKFNKRSLDLEDSQLLLERGDFNLESPDLKGWAVTSLLAPTDENLGDLFFGKNAVEPSECGTTEFVTIQRELIAPLGKDLIEIFGSVETANIVLSNYRVFNQTHTLLDKSEQYFGENGEFTELINRRQHNLEKFWNMPNMVRINGQHSATLNNKEELLKVLPIYYGPGAPAVADQLLYINSLSPYIPESPLFATDGFATIFRGENLIGIGDGIVEILARTGIDEEIVWTGILAHEWAHQIQFLNMEEWYPTGAADNLPEATRYTELEADFFASYYMTHKRGATYNWKRVEQFFNLFFQIGDCSFSSDGHHGTPAQRMEAAHLGYELANDAKKQGQILTTEELHQIFVEQIVEVIPAPSTSK